MRAKGEFALVDQNMQAGFKTSGQPVKRGTMAHDHDVYMLLTESAAQQRNLEALREYTPLLEGLAFRDDHKLYQAIAHRSWGVLHRLTGEYDQAKGRLGQALDLFSELGADWQIGRTLCELAELEVDISDRDRARHLLARAVELFNALHARPDVERTKAALEALS